jgi:hypothetical protein
MSTVAAPRRAAARAVGRCVLSSLVLIGRGAVSQPRDHVGRLVRFADGTSARVYRETAVARAPREPCVLLVSFRLRGVSTAPAHALFRAESLLNTPLFVGFPGFVSKLWLGADDHGTYRGLYEWDGATAAEHYARCLWRVLELVSVPGSIDYRVIPERHRDEVLVDPALLERYAPGEVGAWWRLLPA